MQVLDTKASCQIGDDRDRLEILRSNIATVDEADEVVDLFRLLGDPTRLRILSVLIEAGELGVGSIATILDVNETNISQALRLLRNAGVVKKRRVGRSILYRLEDHHVRLILGLSLDHLSRTAGTTSVIGSVDRISIAKESGAELLVVDEVEAVTGFGLLGDRHAGNPARQVSIQSKSELAAASQRLGREIHIDQTRRNITVDAGNLPRVRGQRLLIGDVELEVFSDAPPCALMTELIGKGARPALKKLAGIHCRVIVGGTIQHDDDLTLVDAESDH
ncbi:MAG: metalloregulator ArsR/SmtB family transcription factor [Acidimicrobiales bacterium]